MRQPLYWNYGHNLFLLKYFHKLTLTNICAHYCIANKTAIIKKTTFFKGAWYKFQ